MKYKGPTPYFSIPISRDLMEKMNANGGKYSGMNKCSLYVPHECHYSQIVYVIVNISVLAVLALI